MDSETCPECAGTGWVEARGRATRAGSVPFALTLLGVALFIGVLYVNANIAAIPRLVVWIAAAGLVLTAAGVVAVCRAWQSRWRRCKCNPPISDVIESVRRKRRER